MKHATPAQQRAERKKFVNQGLQAGLGIVRASYEAAQYMRKKHGLVYLKDDEPHYLHTIGLQPRHTAPPEEDRAERPPVMRGHRRR